MNTKSDAPRSDASTRAALPPENAASAAPDENGARSFDARERFLRIAFLLCAALFLVRLFLLPFYESGDIIEYAAVLHAFASHGWPDVRAADGAFAGISIQAYPGFHLSPLDSRIYGWHFWLYSLACVPAYWLLEACGRSGMAAFQITNGVLFCGAIYMALFAWREAAMWRRASFIGLCAAGAVLPYVFWVGPEMWSFSLLVCALVLAQRKNFAVAALCASFAAMQNPPLLFVAAWIVWCAFHTPQVSRRTRVLACLGAALCLLPNLFYQVFFGTPNLIAARGNASVRYVSLSRTASFFFDLNDGLLPFAPFLLLFFALGTWRALRRRDREMLLLALALFAAIGALQMTVNWNSAAAGLKRYAVWIVPLLAFIAAREMPEKKVWPRLVAVAVAAQMLLFPLLLGDYKEHNAPARWVLARAPALYNPQAEVFVTRGGFPLADGRNWRDFLPVAFAAPGGNVTKVLTRGDDLAKLRPRYFVDAAYESALRKQARGEAFYIHPPRGAIVKK